VQLCLSIPN